MLSLEPEIEREFNRIAAQLPEEEEPGPLALTAQDVLRAHFLVANHFYLEGHGLGGVGPRDIGLLCSAVSRQYVSFGGHTKWNDKFDICATLFFGLIKNHPFYDANKRTAFLSVLYQLYRMGWCPAVSEKQFEDFTVEIAEDKLIRYARFRDISTDGDSDPAIKFISWYLRKNTRRIDKTNYNITYRELQSILNRYGFSLANHHGNYVDIIRMEKRPTILGLFRTRDVQTRLGQIGLPRWTAQVGRGALKTVREVTGLTERQGTDSASFFKGLDPMQTLITTYHEPLMRLAER
jgi:prophage maintenance system killer protein